MVVLSLVLGLSEQDDFANIPDLQNPGTQQKGLKIKQEEHYREESSKNKLTFIYLEPAQVYIYFLKFVFCLNRLFKVRE